MDRVIVIGCGFAGLHAVRQLAGAPVEVTLVDQHNFHTFQPLLYQVATAGLEPGDVAYPARTIIRRKRNIAFRHGRVEAVDLEARAVRLGDGGILDYDHLIVGTGATAGFFDIEGAAAHAHPLYTLDDANHLRNLVLTRLEEVDAHNRSGGPGRLLVVGGGATGVETAGALVELLQVCVRYDRMRLDASRVEVVLIDAAERLLVGFAEELGLYAAETLRSRGVVVRVGTSVEKVTDRGVRLAGGEHLDALVVVWAGGVTVEGTLAGSLAVAHGRGGRVVVGADLSLAGHPEVFVVGDAAAVPAGPGAPAVVPQLAQVAIQSGRHAGRQVLRRMAGRPTEPFAYEDKGMMATIGRRAAVAQLPGGLVLRGTLGWLAWLGLHLVYLIGFRNRLIVLVNWWWRYLNWPGGPRLIDTAASGDLAGAEATGKDGRG
ncbi:MAG TPA: NAD(P)/FAD-dependent oxidoreductase [Acidimicrobiales bacterium]|nr:NAD(P)/FAD-dependent oxidoreductase [Acidimicrobiales bacterium]